MRLRFQRLSDHAVLPEYAKDSDAGLDLTAVRAKYDPDGDFITYHTDLAVEIPSNYFGLLMLRSSASKKQIMMPHGAGVIDSGYRGEIQIRVCARPGHETCDTTYHVNNPTPTERISRQIKEAHKERYLRGLSSAFLPGERVAQLLILPVIRAQVIEADELSDSDRGQGGFGSTGSA